LNTNNYYDSFFKWYDHSVKSGFVSEANYSQLIVDTNPEKLLNRVLEAKMPEDDSWLERLNVPK
jgi:predicted Rossmann-fold nucleotide-binding protein